MADEGVEYIIGDFVSYWTYWRQPGESLVVYNHSWVVTYQRVTSPNKDHVYVKIQIDQHTLERAAERGATESEIINVINNGFPIQAKTWANRKREDLSVSSEMGTEVLQAKTNRGHLSL